jgi:hypothetical protein
MNRVAHLSPDQRNELFRLTAERRGMGSVAVVEKDLDYVAMQDMIFGRCPSFDAILTSLTILEREINQP